jgi:hypothetical protein
MSQKISQLPSVIAANISDTDILPIVATNITSKVTVANLRTKLGTQPPAGGRTVTDAFTYLNNNAVFNVKDFGAFGDGAADDTAAIVLADTKAALVGGKVYFPQGTYKFSSTLTIARRWVGASARGTILKPTAAIAIMAIDLQSDGYIEHMTLDGLSTTGKIGVGIALSALQNILGMNDMFITGFLGVGARGIKIGRLVTGRFDNLYVQNNYINLHTNGGDTPTDTIFVNCQFRTATTKGVWVETALSLWFVKCLFESNGEEGVYLQNTGATAIEIRISGWFEGNWTSVAAGAARHAKYDIFCDGATGPSGTIRVNIRDAYFNGGATAARAIHLTNAIAYVIDNVNLQNEVGQVLIDGTSYGDFGVWPQQNGNWTTNVTFAGGAIGGGWNSRAHLEDNIEAAWTDWVPTYSGSGSMTYTTVTTTKARYKIIGKTCKVELNFAGTTGGVAGISLNATLPANIRSKDANNYVPATVTQDGGATVVLGLIRADGANPTSNLQIFLATGAVFGLGAGRGVFVNFEFELF